MEKLALVAVLAITLAPALVEAQSCVPGRVATDATAGHCCWPGQSWSEFSGRCTGAPACPAGFAGDANECVPMSPSLAYTPSEPIRFERHPNYAVMGGGAALFVATYLSGLLTELTNFVPCGNGAGPIPYFIPFGSFASLACHDAAAATVGVAFGVGQLIGVVLMALGESVFQLNVRADAASVSLGRDGFTVRF